MIIQTFSAADAGRIASHLILLGVSFEVFSLIEDESGPRIALAAEIVDLYLADWAREEGIRFDLPLQPR